MSDIIRLLPDSVANQIAAGEVIQRPASVVKELVENAIDAKASSIQLVLKDAGRTLIQVIDNGVGMTPTDARLAFERHSTSKITEAQDLFSLRTMGFRGEALASIAAIAHVELRTTARGASLGSHLVISGSHCESQEPDVCPEGCNFMIKDLFYNVPARRKFLKSNQVELSNIVKEFEKLALINHEVEFTVSHNGNTLYHLLPGTLKQRVAALWGHGMDDQLIPVSTSTSIVQINGFVCRPENARKRGALQYLFVNGRYMRHPYFHKAIAGCYEQLIPEGCHPNYFLVFNVEPETIDVNIHPTKTEIKFENEFPIWQILSAAVKEALGRYNLVPSIDFDMADAPVIPMANNESVLPPAMGIDPGYNPFAKSNSSGGGGAKVSRRDDVPANWEDLYRNFENNRRSALDEAAAASMSNETATQATLFDNTPELSDDLPCMQIDDSFIVTPVQDGMLVIDQRRAHLTILFDEYMRHIEGAPVPSQSVLFPEVLHLSPSQNALMVEIEPQLAQLGFNLSRLSAGDWSVNGTPGGVGDVNVKELLLKVLESVEQGGASLSEDIYRRIALTIAERAALPRHHRLADDEMRSLVSRLMRVENNRYTPQGNAVLATLSVDQLSKLF